MDIQCYMLGIHISVNLVTVYEEVTMDKVKAGWVYPVTKDSKIKGEWFVLHSNIGDKCSYVISLENPSCIRTVDNSGDSEFFLCGGCWLRLDLSRGYRLGCVSFPLTKPIDEEEYKS